MCNRIRWSNQIETRTAPVRLLRVQVIPDWPDTSLIWLVPEVGVEPTRF